jgi:hypothetical protein
MAALAATWSDADGSPADDAGDSDESIESDDELSDIRAGTTLAIE